MSFVLYALLGLILGISGINVIERPAAFFSIMSVVILIDTLRRP